MNQELIKHILSTSRRVRHVHPDHFQFDWGLKVPARKCESDLQGALVELCEHPEFSIEHLRDLLSFLKD